MSGQHYQKKNHNLVKDFLTASMLSNWLNLIVQTTVYDDNNAESSVVLLIQRKIYTMLMKTALLKGRHTSNKENSSPCYPIKSITK